MVFDNWDKVQSLTQTALNADGTAEQKFNDNYLSSLEAKTKSLQASLESLASTTLSDDMYAGFLDGSKAIVDFATNTDILKASLAGLSTAGGAYAISWIKDVVQGFSDLGSAMSILKSENIADDAFGDLLQMTQGLSESQTKLVLSSTSLTNAQRVAILTNQGVSTAEAQAQVAALGLASAEGTAAAYPVVERLQKIPRRNIRLRISCPG